VEFYRERVSSYQDDIVKRVTLTDSIYTRLLALHTGLRHTSSGGANSKLVPLA